MDLRLDAPLPRAKPASWLCRAACLLMLTPVLACGSVALAAPADRPAVQDLPAPETLEQLRDLETRVQAVVRDAAPATVALNVAGRGTGSGVIVTPDGFILTAAHVIGPPGRLIQVRFPDGSVAPARTLGSDRGNDAGMAKLEGDGPWPFVPMATAASLQPGDWTVALGHPAGFDEERPVVARLGRVVRLRRTFVQSDCALIGGDSGGPLFNLRGQVVGIHSRIGKQAKSNYHVPVGDYQRTWQELAEGLTWGQRQFPLLGVFLDDDPTGRGVVIRGVVPGTAAAKAGIREGDTLLLIDEEPCTDDQTVIEYLALLAPGDPVDITLQRGDQQLTLRAILEPRPE
ncbi:MAG: S1C family serine protease [Planctomycetota bacterium]